MISRVIVGLIMLGGVNCALLAEDSIAEAPPETMTAQGMTGSTETPNVPVQPSTAAVTPAPTSTGVTSPPTTAPTQDTLQPIPTAAPATTVTHDNQAVNCNYQLNEQQTTVDNGLLLKWTTNAVEQSFTFDNTQLNAQLEQLKACFTTQGWQSFYDALNKSGNLTAVTTQQLTVSAMADGQGNITQTKSNEWKITIPLQVVYQNKEQKITQLLNVDALVGRKPAGGLGMMQIVATPREAAAPAAPAATAPAPATPAPTTPVTPAAPSAAPTSTPPAH